MVKKTIEYAKNPSASDIDFADSKVKCNKVAKVLDRKVGLKVIFQIMNPSIATIQ